MQFFWVNEEGLKMSRLIDGYQDTAHNNQKDLQARSVLGVGFRLVLFHVQGDGIHVWELYLVLHSLRYNDSRLCG